MGDEPEIKVKVVVEQDAYGYKVKQMVNTTEHDVGQLLTKEQVENLIAQGVTVTIR